MAVRVYRTAKWIPDEVPVTVQEIYKGNGMTQLVTEVEPPEKEIQYFHWTWPTPKKRSNKWVYHSIAVASIAGCVAVLLLPIVPIVSVPIILGALAWLGFIAWANRT